MAEVVHPPLYDLFLSKSTDNRSFQTDTTGVPYLLGGELPTDHFCGLVHPGDFNGMFVGAISPRL